MTPLPFHTLPARILLALRQQAEAYSSAGKGYIDTTRNRLFYQLLRQLRQLRCNARPRWRGRERRGRRRRPRRRPRRGFRGSGRIQGSGGVQRSGCPPPTPGVILWRAGAGAGVCPRAWRSSSRPDGDVLLVLGVVVRDRLRGGGVDGRHADRDAGRVLWGRDRQG